MVTHIQAALRRGYGLVPPTGRRRCWHFNIRTNRPHLQTGYGKASTNDTRSLVTHLELHFLSRLIASSSAIPALRRLDEGLASGSVL